MSLRFDDSLTTVLKWADDPRPLARALVYRQLIDLMAQRRFPRDSQLRERALAVLRTVREDVPRAIRLEMAQVLGRQRSLPRELAPAFLGDDADIAAPVLDRLQLTDREWRLVLPELAPVLRAGLCQRLDLSDEIRRLAVMLGSTPLALPAPVAAADSAAEALPDIEDGETSIRELIERIENFRDGNLAPPAFAAQADGPPPDYADALALGCDWRWETDRFATISFADFPDARLSQRVGAADGLLGSCLFTLLDSGDVLEAIENCWRRRVPFRNRLVHAVSGLVEGEWLLSGVPVFESRAGLFLGYRGTAHRALAAAQSPLAAAPEAAPPVPEDAPAVDLEPINELAHEVRTPLNAIMGFAQLIEAQVRGPLNPEYQKRAAEIVAESRTMLQTLDAITDVGKASRERQPVDAVAVSPAELVETLVGQADDEAQRRGVFLVKRIGLALPDLYTAPAILHGCVERMILHHVGQAQAGETVVISLLAEGDDAVRIQVRRPVGEVDDQPDAVVARLIALQAHAIGATFVADSPVRWTLAVRSVPEQASGQTAIANAY